MKSSDETLKFYYDDFDGLPIWDEKTPVNVLETFQAAVLGQLLFIDKDYDVKPGLIENFKCNSEATECILTLREGLFFHNGRRVTSQDLEFSILRGFLTKNPWFTTFLRSIEGIDKTEGHFVSGSVSGLKIIDDLTLQVRLERPNPSFLKTLARPFFSLRPIEEMTEDYKDWKNHPVGAGPYQIINVNKGEVVVEKKSESADGPSKIIFTDSLEENDIDASFLSKVDELEKEHFERVGKVGALFFNFDNELGRNIDFRKFVSSIVEGDEIVSDIDGLSAARQILPDEFWGKAKNSNPNDTKGSRTMPIENLKIGVFSYALESEPYSTILDRIKKRFSKAEINVEFVAIDKKAWSEREKALPLRFMELGADVPDPLTMLGLFKKGSPLSPHFDEKDAVFAELIDKAENTQSFDEKVRYTSKASEHFLDQTVTVPLYFRSQEIYFNPRKIESIGLQDAGLVFLLNRVRLR